MATLTASATLTIAAGDLVTETAELVVLPVAGPGEGRGRLVHPTLGAFDYAFAPDRWTNLRGDVVVAPIWASAQTLAGAAATLWPGSLQDVTIEETWSDSYAMDGGQLDLLLQLYQTPPDPADGYLELWPSYASTLGFRVAFVALEVGGQDVALTPMSVTDDVIEGPVVARFRVIGRA